MSRSKIGASRMLTTCKNEDEGSQQNSFFSRARSAFSRRALSKDNDRYHFSSEHPSTELCPRSQLYGDEQDALTTSKPVPRTVPTDIASLSPPFSSYCPGRALEQHPRRVRSPDHSSDSSRPSFCATSSNCFTNSVGDEMNVSRTRH